MSAIPAAFTVLLGMDLLGEMLRQALHLPMPGPLIGMLLLTLVLVARGAGDGRGVPPALARVSEGLIGNMGLLFVPAGVGIVTELGLLRQDWLALLAGLLISTTLGLAVTGLVMHHVSRHGDAAHRQDARPDMAAAGD